MLRLTRATRFFPRFPGINVLQKAWGRVLNPAATYRISNFDGNLKLDVNMGEAMGATLWHLPHRFERKERELFCAAVVSGCTVLDVGANIGIYTLLAAKRGATVFSIEADPENARRLRDHLVLNNLESRVFEMAASDSVGRVSLRRNPTNCGGSTVMPGDSIPASTIDSLNLPPIDICKMDIEGAELAALRGMKETLRRSPSMKLLVEYNELSDRTALLGFLREHFRNITPVKDSLWCY